MSRSGYSEDFDGETGLPGDTYRRCSSCGGTGNVIEPGSFARCDHFPRCSRGHIVICPACDGARYFDVQGDAPTKSADPKGTR